MDAFCAYLLVGEAIWPARGPYRPSTKNVYKSIFPTSNVNSDSRFEFYAKFYVRIRLVRYPPCIIFLSAVATKRKNLEKWHNFADYC